jgi:hypothetical protein
MSLLQFPHPSPVALLEHDLTPDEFTVLQSHAAKFNNRYQHSHFELPFPLPRKTPETLSESADAVELGKHYRIVTLERKPWTTPDGMRTSVWCLGDIPVAQNLGKERSES